MNVSKCHWNHGPSGTSSGSVVRTGSHPISATSAAEDLAAQHPRQHLAAEAQPEHRHVVLARAFRISRASRGTNGLWSSNAANSEPSDTIRSYALGSTSRSSRSIRHDVDLRAVRVQPLR